MQRIFLTLFLIIPFFITHAHAQLSKELKVTYYLWQKSMVEKDFNAWKSTMASERQIEVKNRILSEKFSFPADIFRVPFMPPKIQGLKMLSAKESGVNAKAVFFGRIDFNVGGTPENNLMVVSYKKEGGKWRYVETEYVNLAALPAVRKELESGNYSYLSQADFQPSAYKRKNSVVLNRSVPIIAKVYAYCPGREVRAVCNSVSNHLFQNTKEAEVIIGGAKPGVNEIKMSIKSLPGGQQNEPITVRVYLFSQVQGVKPIKAYEYLVKEGGRVDGIVIKKFEVTNDMIKTILGKK